MSIKFASVLSGVCVLLVTSVAGQVTALEDRSVFSPQAIEIAFGPAAPEAPFDDRYTDLGVDFLGAGGSRPLSELHLDMSNPAFFEIVLVNARPEGATSSGLGLIIQFRRPVIRVGMELGNGPSSTTAELRAYARGGRLLGSVQRQGPLGFGSTFFGVDTNDPEGIQTLVVDYGDEANSEQIDNLIFDPLDARPVSTCIAQIADGQAGDRRLSTIIQLQPRHKDDRVSVEVFDSAGQPLEITLNGQTGSSFEFDIAFGDMVSLETGGTSDPLVVGYACIESTFPLVANGIYRTSDGEETRAEAGISGVRRAPHWFAVAESDPARRLETAIAIANPNDARATVRLCLFFDLDGSRRQRCEVVRLQPRAHRSFFLREELADLPAGAFVGTLLFEVTTPSTIVVTALRTVDGVPVSSLRPERIER